MSYPSPQEAAGATEVNWRKIEAMFFKRASKIFDCKLSDTITVYLTHNERCTYNLKERYFFVRIGSASANVTIMHELLHFFTYEAFGAKLLAQEDSREKYNDIKEALTELLNTEFKDLMDGQVDRGYAQHQDLRLRVREYWGWDKNMGRLIQHLLEL